MTVTYGTGTITSPTFNYILPDSGFLVANTVQTPAGTSFSLYAANQSKNISAKLYIKYVKSKLTKIQLEKLQTRIHKLAKMTMSAHRMEQTALYESLSLVLAVTIRESEAYACGIDTFIERKDVEKYLYEVKDKTVLFKSLDQFPRLIPENIQQKIKEVKDANLFDKLEVLYIDYTNEKLKDNKEKIQEKDPILFGSYNYSPDRLYFIADWVDDYCDLTLNKFIDKIKESNPEFGLSKIPEINDEFIEVIKREVKQRHERLASTNRDNFRDNMTKEDIDKQNRKIDSKLPWYKKILKRINK